MRLSKFLIALAPLALAACLDTTAPTAYARVEDATFAPALEVDLANSTRTTNGVYYRDITPGTGATVTATSSVSINYVGYLSTGAAFGSLKAGDPNSPLVIRLGAPPPDGAIPGLEEGMVGMQVGGRRQIIIPPNLAYGLDGAVNDNNVLVIPGNAVILFNVDLVAAN
jgi:peptidylprolyl isomerase